MKISSLFSISVWAMVWVGLTVDDGTAQQKTLKEQLVGTWTFVSSTGKLSDGTPAWGSNPSGLLIFSENGRYSSIIVRTDIPKFAANNRMQGTPEENSAAVRGGIGGFGTYTVDEAKKSFTVKFEGSTYPNQGGTEQTRPIAINGDELKITNPSSTYAGQTELIYKRAK
jgi:hypothetical protein